MVAVPSKLTLTPMVLVRWLKAVTWKDGNGLFIQPYAKLSALTLEGVDYQLNGVDVHSDSYNSVLGEAGTRVVMTSLWATRPLNLI
ncbi:hypothetical protein DMI65_06645 [Escherichia coli]|nr:hypothetical protein [Escherichia coli]